MSRRSIYSCNICYEDTISGKGIKFGGKASESSLVRANESEKHICKKCFEALARLDWDTGLPVDKVPAYKEPTP